MSKVSATLEKVLSSIAAVGIIGMMLHTIVHALARHLFNAPLPGTNELVTYWYMPIITLIGFVVAQWRNEHISVSLLFDRLRDRNQFEYVVFGRVLGILLCGGFVWFGLLEALESMRIGGKAGVTAIPSWPVAFLVPASFSALAILYLREVLTGESAVTEPAPVSTAQPGHDTGATAL